MKGQSKNYNFVLFLLLLLNLGAFSQINFDNPQFINKKSGLPSDKVNAILKDELGFMWFSTDEGLCRWDGISVRTFEHISGDSSSISGNYIPRNAYVLDTVFKQILLATENGLSFFDRSSCGGSKAEKKKIRASVPRPTISMISAYG